MKDFINNTPELLSLLNDLSLLPEQLKEGDEQALEIHNMIVAQFKAFAERIGQ